MNYNTKRKHKLRQATAKKKAPVKKGKKKSKTVTYTIFLRKNRSAKRVMADETITHFNEDAARKLAASKNPNFWVSISPMKGGRARV